MQVLATNRAVGLYMALLLTVTGVVQAQSPTLSLDQIVSRMQAAESASRQARVPYTVTRLYTLSDTNPKTPDAEVTAQIKFTPPGEKDYTLGKPSGSASVEKIVRKVLDQEAEMSSHFERGEITSRNYDFALLGEQVLAGRNCYVLQLKPRRSAPELLQGKAWVDADDYRIRQIEGEPAKSPSFWVKDVHLSLEYGEVLGMWVQLAARAEADVRLMGHHVLTSQVLDFRCQSLTAKNPAPAIRSNSWRSVADAATWVAR